MRGALRFEYAQASPIYMLKIDNYLNIPDNRAKLSIMLMPAVVMSVFIPLNHLALTLLVTFLLSESEDQVCSSLYAQS